MRTPLRYPGGKRKFVPLFLKILKRENIKNGIFVEPYCGGAGAAVQLLLNKNVKKIYLNDIDRSIYAFWWAVLNENERFIRKIKNTKITIREFYKQKEMQKNKNDVSLFDLGFSTFFINRTSFSGILTGGPIGGIKQEGNYKIDCRFNKEDLINRIKNIYKYKKNIRIFNKDAIDFLKLKTIKNLPKNETIFYIDPPYFEKGPELYLNSYAFEDHKNIEKFFRKIKRVIISYDKVLEIKNIYKNWNKYKYVEVFHSAGNHKFKKEMIFSNF